MYFHQTIHFILLISQSTFTHKNNLSFQETKYKHTNNVANFPSVCIDKCDVTSFGCLKINDKKRCHIKEFSVINKLRNKDGKTCDAFTKKHLYNNIREVNGITRKEMSACFLKLMKLFMNANNVNTETKNRKIIQANFFKCLHDIYNFISSKEFRDIKDRKKLKKDKIIIFEFELSFINIKDNFRNMFAWICGNLVDMNMRVKNLLVSKFQIVITWYNLLYNTFLNDILYKLKCCYYDLLRKCFILHHIVNKHAICELNYIISFANNECRFEKKFISNLIENIRLTNIIRYYKLNRVLTHLELLYKCKNHLMDIRNKLIIFYETFLDVLKDKIYGLLLGVERWKKSIMTELKKNRDRDKDMFQIAYCYIL